MSAWYLFTALGFYPVCPGSDYYVIGSPAVSRAAMNLSNGKKLTITAENLSDANVYVQSVRVNGKPWNSVFLPHREIAKGGRIEFVLGPQPNKAWGSTSVLPK
jgi:putative alpha-1,2-mannosidase